jgi:hypothetical protein
MPLVKAGVNGYPRGIGRRDTRLLNQLQRRKTSCMHVSATKQILNRGQTFE